MSVFLKDTLTDNTRLSADILHIIRDQTGDFTVARLLAKLLVLGIKVDFFPGIDGLSRFERATP